MQTLEQLIKEDRFEDFKLFFKSTTINSHHKNVLLGKCFSHGNIEFIEYMFSKAHISNDVIAPFFLNIIKEPIDTKNLAFFDSLNDSDIIKKIDHLFIEPMIEKQSADFFDWFLHKFPMTSVKNFKTIAYTSIKNDKPQYIRPFNDLMFDKSTCYNFCLCCFEYDKTHLADEFLKAQAKKNPNIILELKEQQKELYKDYVRDKNYIIAMQQAYLNSPAYAAAMLRMNKPKKVKKGAVTPPVVPTVPVPPPVKKPAKQELLNDFLQDQLAKVFSDYLEDKFPVKDKDLSTKKNKI